MENLGKAILVLGVGESHLFDGESLDTTHEVTLFNLSTQQELRLPVTHDQAQAILELYLSDMVPQLEDPPEVQAPVARTATKPNGKATAAAQAPSGGTPSVQQF